MPVAHLTTISEIIFEYYKLATSIHASTAGEVAVLYDTLLSLSDEIEYIWCRKLSLGSICYLLARYGVIFKFALQLSFVAPPVLSIQACNAVAILFSIFTMLASVGISGLQMGRAYAICARMPVIKVILLLLFVIQQAVTGAAVFRHIECDAIVDNLDNLLADLTGVTTLVLDLVVLLACSYELHKSRKGLPEMIQENSLMTLMYKQGFYQFAVIGTLDLVIVIGDQVTNDSIFISIIVSTIENVLAPVLMCHFLIQLKKSYYGPNEISIPTVSDIGFRSRPASTLRSFVARIDKEVVNEFGVREPMFKLPARTDDGESAGSAGEKVSFV